MFQTVSAADSFLKITKKHPAIGVQFSLFAFQSDHDSIYIAWPVYLPTNSALVKQNHIEEEG